MDFVVFVVLPAVTWILVSLLLVCCPSGVYCCRLFKFLSKYGLHVMLRASLQLATVQSSDIEGGGLRRNVRFLLHQAVCQNWCGYLAQRYDVHMAVTLVFLTVSYTMVVVMLPAACIFGFGGRE